MHIQIIIVRIIIIIIIIMTNKKCFKIIYTHIYSTYSMLA